MFRRAFFVTTLGLMFAGLGPAVVFANGRGMDGGDATVDDGDASKRAVSWSVQELLGDIGPLSYVSVAADAVRGTVFISYYDPVNQALISMRTEDTFGNCGPGNSWFCDQGFVGRGPYNSMAVHRAGDHLYQINARYDSSNERLEALISDYWTGGASSTTHTIDSGIAGFTDRTGMYIAVEYDSNGVVWIAYQNETYGGAVGVHRLIAQWVGDGSGNCGSGLSQGDWDCNDLFFNASYGSFSSTGLTIDVDDHPIAAFYDPILGYPLVAYHVGPGGTCGPSNTWVCYSVQTLGSDTGRHVVPFVERDRSLVLFYQNVTGGKLERAEYVGVSLGNCGFNSTGSLTDEWQCDAIDDMDGVFMTRGIAVESDTAGYPIVAYQQSADPGPGVLRVARPVASPAVGSAGNCGPSSSWYCQDLDGGAFLREADSVALAVDQRGDSFLAYQELNDYPFPAEHNLKMATLPSVVIFADGFESGNLSAWSATQP